MMQIEVIAQNGAEAAEAERLDVDRLELVANIEEGGLTPSPDVIDDVLNRVSIPVQVMIRPHSESFYYNENTVKAMLRCISRVVASGGRGIVFGALTKEGFIDEKALSLITHAYPEIDITFHRAFDEAENLVEALVTLEKYPQVKRILTSGGARDCLDGKRQLKMLRELSDERGGPEILPGAGLSPDNISLIHTYVQANQYHFGRAVREHASFEHPFSKRALEKIYQHTKQ